MNLYDPTSYEQINQLRDYQEQLSQLNRSWDAISSMGVINQDLLMGQGQPLLDSMSETRKEFTLLQQRLMRSLMEETLGKVYGELGFYAQNSIDILIRNLFERTADVGFLATDSVVVKFLQEQSTVSESDMRQRLNEYTQKYSVYDQILLVDRYGKIACALDPTQQGDTTDRSLLYKTDRAEDYFEYLGPTSFRPQQSLAHVFAKTVANNRGEPIGHLLMFFRLEDEMAQIFADMTSMAPDLTLLIINDQKEILFSSQPRLATPGSTIEDRPGTLRSPLKIGGKNLLSVARETTGYQGYLGLQGLQAIALTPMEAAVNQRQSCNRRTRSTTEGQATVTSESLRQINRESNAIHRKLQVITVNGKCLAARLNAKTFVPILENIQEVGSEITGVVSESINQLNFKATSKVLSDCRLYSSLAIDIMDRNLYERANDCRWWALTPEFRAITAAKDPSSDAQKELTAQLKLINELYTVYTNLLIYNADGRILACSDDEQQHLIGTQYPDAALQHQCLNLHSTQQYCVSEFQPTSLYRGKATYVYHAGIRNQANRPQAGIAIVFDSGPEFTAMLRAALPTTPEGEPLEGSCGLFIDRQGEVISSERAPWGVGSRLTLPSQILNLESGQSCEMQTSIGGHQVLLGATASKGYREYKTTGDYDNDVIAIVAVVLDQATASNSEG